MRTFLPNIIAVFVLSLRLGAQTPTELQRLQDEAVQRAKEYLRINTANPPGNEEASMKWFARILQQEGIPFDTVSSAPGRGNIWARLKGGNEPALMLLHHMDVVPADPRYWDVDPYSADVRNGDIYGRGALDTKMLGIVHFQTFVALHRLSGWNALGRLRRDIRVLGVKVLGVKTGRIATGPTIRTTAPITATLPSFRAAAGTATISAPLANAGTTTDEVVAVDASGGAADRATGPIVAARCSPAPIAASAAISARAAAATAAPQSLAALSAAFAATPQPLAPSRDIVCLEASEQAGKAANGDDAQGLAAGCMVT